MFPHRLMTIFALIMVVELGLFMESHPAAVEAATQAGPYTTELTKLNVDPDETDALGTTLALSANGNVALIGAAGRLAGNRHPGAAFVFTRNGTIWSQQAKLVASDGNLEDGFGFAVALSADGNTALVGAYKQAVDGHLLQGKAYVFTYDGSHWLQQAQFTAADGAAKDRFGETVALSGDGNTALVGAINKTVSGVHNPQGAVYVFTRSGTVWSQQALLSADNSTDATKLRIPSFGKGLALSANGNIALIGASSTSVNNVDSQGAAFVFSRTGTAWTQQTQLIARDGAANDSLGKAVALSADGSIALLSAHTKLIGNQIAQGAAYIFVHGDTGWSQQVRLFASDGVKLDSFGESVALSGNGEIAIVGAPAKSVDSHKGQGATYVYFRSGNNWTPRAEWIASNGATNDFFGSFTALSGDGSTALVDGNTHPNRDFGQGTIYVFAP
jgi:hypothetical protein